MLTTVKPSTKLIALTTAALALPGLVPKAYADKAATKTEVGYRYSNYQESEANPQQTLQGDTERYHVDVHQFHLLKPIDKALDISLDIVSETMSGASPMGYGRDSANKPALIMSGASIQESRQDVLAKVSQYFKNGRATIASGYSVEDDYSAFNGGIDGQYHFNDNHTTLSGGFGFSLDEITPVESGLDDRFPDRVDKKNKNSFTAFTGVSQVIDRNTVVQLAANMTKHNGYLSDPYKLIDKRPSTRTQLSLHGKLRYFIKKVKAALHVNYRFYNDDWGVNSQTLESEWHQNLGRHFKIIPSIRYYSQSQADFYFSSDDLNRTGFQSSDYRLSPYGAMTTGLKLKATWGDWSVSMAIENYQSESDLALLKVGVENPGLVQFTTVSLGINGKF